MSCSSRQSQSAGAAQSPVPRLRPTIFLVLVHETYPEATISRLKELLTDRSKFILNPEAVAVLDAYITRGYGDYVPEWR